MAALSEFGDVSVIDPASTNAALADLSVWVTTVVDPVTQGLIDRFPSSLGLIASIGVGVDHIDLAAASRRGIAVSNTPVVTEDTADLAMALMLATCRRLSNSERLLRAGEFMAGAASLGQRVHGKTLGIVGLGDIGQAVAKRALGFDMSIAYTGPRRKIDAEARLEAQYYDSLEALLGCSDIVSLHCSLNDSSRHLINKESLGWMKPGAVLINTGRGALVDEAALVQALREGHLGGAGLDVFEFEPNVSPELHAFDNVTLLPHIGSATVACRADMAHSVVSNVAAFVKTGAPIDVVPSR